MDDTIEPPMRDFDGAGQLARVTVDGYGSEHQCKDPGILFDVVEQSERQAYAPWNWETGDTVVGIFGGGEE